MTGSLDAWSLAALDALPVGVAVADARAPDLPLVFVNAAFRRTTGYETEEVLGKNPRFLQGPATELEGIRVLREAIARAERAEVTLVNYKKDGTPFRNHVVLEPVRDADGELTHFLAVQEDVTARERAAAEARAIAERLERASETSHDAVWDWDLGRGRILCNARMHELLDTSPDTWDYDAWRARLDPETRDELVAACDRALADPERTTYEHTYRIRGREDEWLWVRDRLVVLRTADGRPYRVLGTITDVTAEALANDKLRAKAHRFRRLLDLAFEGVNVLDARGTRIFRNATAEALAAEHGLIDGLEAVHPDDRERTRAETERLFREPGAKVDALVRTRTKSGGYRWLETRSQNRLDDPDVRGIVIHWRDVTERIEREREREEASTRERRLRELVQVVEDVARVGAWEIHVATNTLRWSPGTYRIHDVSPETYAPTLDTALAFYAPDHRDAIKHAMRENVEQGVTYSLDLEVMTAKGKRVPVRATGRAERRDGEVVRLYGAIQDMSQEQVARAALRRQAAVIDQIRDAIVTLDLEGRVVSWNEGATRLYGLSAADVLGTQPSLWEPGTRSPEPARDADLGSDEQIAFDAKAQRSGELFDVRVTLTPFHDEAGVRVGVIVLAQDTTETRRLQRQLEASQRMEAIGLLAGGVAHDFNNLLTVVQGNAENLLAMRDASPEMRGQLVEVRDAARRAADLTRQLLAFGRKQVLRPVRIELSALVLDMMRLLQRVVGEHITLVAELGTAPSWVEADRAQLEQVLLNLAVNARDAMPAGGRLTVGVVEAHFAEPSAELAAGDYHGLVVRDGGVGMDEPTRARIFEPFFTTKDPSQGTGLGLATVYGIVKQSGGTIQVDSEPGKGSTFTVLLPRAPAQVVARAPEAVEVASSVETGDSSRETILLVEDDDAVRRVCRRILEKLGYSILEAPRPSLALEIAHERPTGIDLVLTDIVMPGMSGAELVQRLKKTHPGIRYVLISGYADDMDQLRAAIGDGMTFLPKPFTPDQLGRAIRQALS